MHNLILLKKLISVQIRSQMQYRLPFFFDIAGTFFITLTEFGAVALVLPKFGSIGGWMLGDIALLYGLVNISFGLMDLIFSGFDPSHFGRNIRQGLLDQILLRPIHVSIQILGSAFTLRRLGRIIMGLIILFYSFQLSNITWTFAKSSLVILTIFSQIIYFGGLFVIGATITFWTIDSIEFMNIFTYGGIELISFPMHIYPDMFRKFFTFILPAIFINYYPALYILDKPDPFNMPNYAPWLGPIVSLLILFFAGKFWDFGLKHYQSTGT